MAVEFNFKQFCFFKLFPTMNTLKDIEQSPSPWSSRGRDSTLWPAQPAGDRGRLSLFRVQGSKYTLIKFERIANRKKYNLNLKIVFKCLNGLFKCLSVQVFKYSSVQVFKNFFVYLFDLRF